MKKYLFLPLFLFAFSCIGQSTPKKKIEKVKELPDSAPILRTVKYKDAVDGQLKGPKGEKVYIDSAGSRYYRQGKQKIYLSGEPAKSKIPKPFSPAFHDS
jgi:hypothetical protein